MRKDYYEILGVARDATPEEIKRAYRRLARKYHPDVSQEPEAEERFKEISEAYAVLSDPERRRRYDLYGPDGQDEGLTGSLDIFEIFRQAFGFDVGQERATPGQDLECTVTLSLEEVLTGASREIELTRHVLCEQCRGSGAAPEAEPRYCRTCGGQGRVRRVQQSFFGTIATVISCPHCHGRGTIIVERCATCEGTGLTTRTERLTIEIPPGIEDGQYIHYPGEGDRSPGGPPGDLYVHVRIEPDPRFTRQGATIRSTVPIHFWQAALGARLKVPTLEGETEIEVPPGTQSGTEIVLPHKGLPQLRRRGRGPHIITLQVVTPTQLTPRQRELLEQLAEAFGDMPPTTDNTKGFFHRLRDTLKGE